MSRGVKRPRNREKAAKWVECHGPPGEIGQLAGLLDYVESRTCRDVAAWLRTLAKPGTDASCFYEDAARQLDDGYVPRARARRG